MNETHERVRRMLAGLVALLCMTLPTGAIYAQATPDATGTVSCVQVDGLAEVTTVTYTVDWYFDTGLVVNRWGTGLDETYSSLYAFQETSRRFTTLTMYFHSAFIGVPTTPTEEDLYSETGVWEIRIAKGNAVAITGRSFVVRDMPTGPRHGGECTWTLKGTLQAT